MAVAPGEHQHSRERPVLGWQSQARLCWTRIKAYCCLKGNASVRPGAVCLIPYLLNWVLGFLAIPTSRCFGKMLVSTTCSPLALLQKSTQDPWGHSISQMGEVVKCVMCPKVHVKVRCSTTGQARHRATPRAPGFLKISSTLQEDGCVTNGVQISLSCFHGGNDEDVLVEHPTEA